MIASVGGVSKKRSNVGGASRDCRESLGSWANLRACHALWSVNTGERPCSPEGTTEISRWWSERSKREPPEQPFHETPAPRQGRRKRSRQFPPPHRGRILC